MKPIRVLVVDDSGSARALIRALVEEDPRLSICGEACNGREAVEQVLALKPNIVTMDLQMPEMDGMTAIEEIMARCARPPFWCCPIWPMRATPCRRWRGARWKRTGKPTIDDGPGLTARLRMLARCPGDPPYPPQWRRLTPTRLDRHRRAARPPRPERSHPPGAVPSPAPDARLAGASSPSPHPPADLRRWRGSCPRCRPTFPRPC